MKSSRFMPVGAACDGTPSTGVEVLEVLSSLQRFAHPDSWMSVLDWLASCESGIRSLVNDSRAAVALERKASLAASLAAASLMTSKSTGFDAPSLLHAAIPPYWAEASGPLRLVRTLCSLKSPESAHGRSNLPRTKPSRVRLHRCPMLTREAVASLVARSRPTRAWHTDGRARRAPNL